MWGCLFSSIFQEKNPSHKEFLKGGILTGGFSGISLCLCVFFLLLIHGSFSPRFGGPDESSHLCKVCRSAAVKFSPEIARGRCHGKCREISGEISWFLFSQETKLESAQNFSRQISHHFSRDALQMQMPNLMAVFTLQMFVPESS